jgi:transglutaminase/protease-like cytokinesis protein 3
MSKTAQKKSAKRKPYAAFPYAQIAKMWAQNKSISVIAQAIGRVDKNNPKDPYHSLRNCLYRMHKGYRDRTGRIVRLPHRVSAKRVRACKQAGLRAWA